MEIISVFLNNKFLLGTVQMLNFSWAEPNKLCWVKYMKSLASASIRNTYFNLDWLNHSSCLTWVGISTLERLWNKFDSDAKFSCAEPNAYKIILEKLLTEAKAPYSLRNHRHFAPPKWKTDCFKNTFILSSCLKYN